MEDHTIDRTEDPMNPAEGARESTMVGVKQGLERLPTVIASSVVRSAHQGESHGGVYLVDLENGLAEQVIDWNDDSINWEGRGADRGLRGIAFHEDEVYLAASDEVFVYTKDFRLKRSIRNRYLKHCHEIHIADGRLYLTSTGFDSVLEYDLASRSFVRGLCVRFAASGKLRRSLRLRPLPRLRTFDPNSDQGPAPEDTCHVNSVFVQGGTVFVAGTRMEHLLAIDGSKLSSYARIPHTTHNARPYAEGVLLNSTHEDSVCYLDRRGKVLKAFPVKRYGEGELINSHLPRDNARQAFGRGLCVLGDGLLAGGSSPATISVYQFDASEPLKTINLTMDVRNSVHGLETWPF
jgi:hypothetical protein